MQIRQNFFCKKGTRPDICRDKFWEIDIDPVVIIILLAMLKIWRITPDFMRDAISKWRRFRTTREPILH